MQHPFDLGLSELEAVHAHIQCLTEAALETISGGSFEGRFTTMALGEEGGDVSNSRRLVKPRSHRALSSVFSSVAMPQ